jgi:hypothetical protein
VYVYEKLFKGKVFDGARLRVLTSQLIKLAEEYLTVKRFKEEKLDSSKFLLKELNERKLHPLFNTNFNEFEKELTEKHKIDQTFFLKKYDLEYQKIDYLISIDEQVRSAHNVLSSGENLICFFLISLLNLRHELLIQQEVLNLNFDFNLIERFTECLDLEKLIFIMQNSGFKYHPIIKIYHLMILAYTVIDKDEYYFEIKELISKHIDAFTYNEKFNLYVILESICLVKISSGKREFYETNMDLYTEMISGNIYLTSGKDYFQLNLFRNIFTTAVITKRFEWAEKFIDEYSGKLSPEHSADMYHFSRAVICFEKSQYEKALNQITKVNQDFFVFKLDVKIQMLKIYYELNLFEQALSLTDTFSHYVSKNLTGSDKERFINFIKQVKNMIKIKSGTMIFDDFWVKKDIMAGNIISKRWILEKVNELKPSKLKN